MEWKEKCIAALYADKLFETEGHYSRFRELIDCFSSYPFFTKGLCKCMYLSAWDEEHFCVILETLTDLSLGKDTNTKEMSIKGEALAAESQDADSFMYEFSKALLDDVPFNPSTDIDLPDEVRYIFRQALKASDLIDSL